MMESSHCSVLLWVHMTTVPLPLSPLPGLNLDSFSGLPFVKGAATRSRSQSATFLYRPSPVVVEQAGNFAGGFG